MNKIFNGTLVLGGIFLLMGLWILIDAYNSTGWNQVQGSIKEIRVNGRIINASNSINRKLEYIVEMEYSYNVNNIHYTGSRYSLGSGDTIEDGFNSKSDARKWIKTSPYRSGESITVYVNPSNPESTVLSSGINASTLIPSFMGLILIAIAFLIRFILKRQKTQVK